MSDHERKILAWVAFWLFLTMLCVAIFAQVLGDEPSPRQVGPWVAIVPCGRDGLPTKAVDQIQHGWIDVRRVTALVQENGVPDTCTLVVLTSTRIRLVGALEMWLAIVAKGADIPPTVATTPPD